MKRSIGAVTGLAIIGLVGLLWYGFGKDPSIIPNPLVRHPAPLFTLRSTDHRLVRLDSLHGRPVVINFFASWCVSCREQEGNLVRAYERWRRRVTFVGIIYQDSASDAAAFTRSHGGAWTDLVDSGATTAVNYGVTGVPETFFVNSKGMVVAHTVSLQPGALESGIEQALKAHQ
jgi:cytochrome c biogenesis protein CcmG, thiol:disulfide interchange protein DsbE